MLATSGSRLAYGEEVLRVNGSQTGKDFKSQQEIIFYILDWVSLAVNAFSAIRNVTIMESIAAQD